LDDNGTILTAKVLKPECVTVAVAPVAVAPLPPPPVIVIVGVLV
jgi:hypothetical protein